MNSFKSEEGKQAIMEFYKNILSRWPVPHKSYFIKTGFGNTHVIDSGTQHKEVVLLLHGSCSNSATWMGDVKLYSQSFRTIAIDILGEPGLSEDNRLSLSGNETAEWLLEIADKLKVKKVGLIGMSLGGWYALKFAVTFPDRIKKLSLIAPGGLAPQRIGFIWKSLFYMLLGKKGIEKINRLVYHKTSVDREVHEFGSLVNKHFYPIRESLPIFNDEEIRRLQFPIQYFGGTRDSLLNSGKSAERLEHLLDQIQVNLLEDVGHVIIDQGDKISKFHSP